MSVVKKAKNLLKYGRNEAVSTTVTGFTVWATGQDDAHETLVADGVNSIDSISSDEAADDQVITIEGHTEEVDQAGNFQKTFVEQDVTLNGATRVVLGTPLNRVARAYNADTSDLTGEVFVYEETAIVAGKPTDTSKIHLTILRFNQSEKAQTSMSSQDYWMIAQMQAAVLEKTAAFADITLQIRETGKVWRTVATMGAGQSQGIFEFTPYVIAPPNSDIRLVAVASGAATDVSASIHGYLAVVV